MADKDLVSVGAKTLSQMSPIGIGVSAAQGALGIAQTVSGIVQQKKWLKQLKAFQTPEEVGKMLNLTQNMAQQGYDAFTLDYLTSNIDRAADASLGAATRLGADANQLSDVLDQRMQGLMRVGAENHNLNMANINKYMTALDVVGKNKEAEWASQQDIVKSNLQLAAQNKQSGLQNIAGAANNLINLEAAKNTANLYLDKQRANSSSEAIPLMTRIANIMSPNDPRARLADTKASPIKLDLTMPPLPPIAPIGGRMQSTPSYGGAQPYQYGRYGNGG